MRLGEEEAVRLFYARASDARGAPVLGDRDLVRAIVERLAGHRVAILLAAARADVSSIEEIARSIEALDGAEVPRASLREKLAESDALRAEGRLAEAARELLAVIEAANEDPWAGAEAHRLLGSVLRTQGRFEDALEHKERARSKFRELSADAEVARATGEIGTVLAGFGRLAEARGYHEEALAQHRLFGRRKDEGVEMSYLGVVLQRAGLLEDAHRAHVAALAVHVEVGHDRLLAAEHLHLGVTLHELGRIEEALERFEEAEARFRNCKDDALRGVAFAYWGSALSELRRFDAAGAQLRQAFAMGRRAASPRHEAMASLALAMLHEELGEPSQRDSALARALELGRGRVETEHEAWTRALVGPVGAATKELAVGLEDRLTAKAIQWFALVARPDDAGEAAQRIAVAEGGLPEDGKEPVLWGIRCRYALRRLRAISPKATVTLVVEGEGRSFTFGGDRVDLSRRAPLRRIFVRLLEERDRASGAGLGWQVLLAAGWPDEKVLADAGFGRVRNAVSQLRTLGLKDVLRTEDGGYLLDPNVPLRRI